MSQNDDSVLKLVQVQADMTQFNEYLLARRRALLNQAKALEGQRAAVLQEAAWITHATGVKIKQDKD